MEQKTEQKKRIPQQDDSSDILIRILGQDIPGHKNLYSGLTRIKGISWAVSNALCLQMGLDKRTRISSLSKEDIAKIEKKLRSFELPSFMKNRRKDPETGEEVHLLTNDLDIKHEFDIKRMKKMRSYKGIRHSAGQPVRGQRTRSHFRKKGGAVGIKRAKKDDKKA